MKRFRASLAALMLSVSTLVFLTGGQSVADEYGTCDSINTGCLPDSSIHTWCFAAVPTSMSALRTSIGDAMTRLENKTDMGRDFLESCNSTVDAKWREGGDLTEFELGSTKCDDVTGNVCFSSREIVNLSAHDYFADDPDGLIPHSDGNVESGEVALNRDLTACHEIGHGVGLTHHDLAWYNDFPADCMRNPWLEPEVTGTWRDYNQHHIDHINANF